MQITFAQNHGCNVKYVNISDVVSPQLLNSLMSSAGSNGVVKLNPEIISKLRSILLSRLTPISSTDVRAPCSSNVAVEVNTPIPISLGSIPAQVIPSSEAIIPTQTLYPTISDDYSLNPSSIIPCTNMEQTPSLQLLPQKITTQLLNPPEVLQTSSAIPPTLNFVETPIITSPCSSFSPMTEIGDINVLSMNTPLQSTDCHTESRPQIIVVPIHENTECLLSSSPLNLPVYNSPSLLQSALPTQYLSQQPIFIEEKKKPSKLKKLLPFVLLSLLSGNTSPLPTSCKSNCGCISCNCKCRS